MFTFNLNIQSADELEKCLEILDRKGLLSGKPCGTVVPVATLPPAASKGKGPSDYFARLSARSATRLAELGLTNPPKATDEEKALQKQINDELGAAGKPKIMFRLDLVGREEALAAKGYDIYDQSPAQAEDSVEEETGEDFKIDLENPVV